MKNPISIKVFSVLIIAVLATGCGILYKQPIYQGNLLEKSNVEQLAAGMTKRQVSVLLGSPAISDPFHQSRWDYVASERVGRRARTEVKNLTLYFDGDALSRWEGEYFPEQDVKLAQDMVKFGNLPKDKDKKPRR